MSILRITDKKATKVRKLRDQIAEVDDQLKALDSLPPPREEIEQRVEQWIEAQAESGIAHTTIGGFVDPNHGGLTTNAGFEFSNEGRWQVNILTEFMKIQAAIAPEPLKASLMALVDRHLKDRKIGPPLSERPALRADLKKERHALEVDEEREIERIESADGVIIHRRSDANPAIILAET